MYIKHPLSTWRWIKTPSPPSNVLIATIKIQLSLNSNSATVVNVTGPFKFFLFHERCFFLNLFLSGPFLFSHFPFFHRPFYFSRFYLFLFSWFSFAVSLARRPNGARERANYRLYYEGTSFPLSPFSTGYLVFCRRLTLFLTLASVFFPTFSHCQLDGS